MKIGNLAGVGGPDVGSADGAIVLLFPPLRDAVVTECVPAIYTKYHCLIAMIFNELSEYEYIASDDNLTIQPLSNTGKKRGNYKLNKNIRVLVFF